MINRIEVRKGTEIIEVPEQQKDELTLLIFQVLEEVPKEFDNENPLLLSQRGIHQYDGKQLSELSETGSKLLARINEIVWEKQTFFEATYDYINIFGDSVQFQITMKDHGSALKKARRSRSQLLLKEMLPFIPDIHDKMFDEFGKNDLLYHRLTAFIELAQQLFIQSENFLEKDPSFEECIAFNQDHFTPLDIQYIDFNRALYEEGPDQLKKMNQLLLQILSGARYSINRKIAIFEGRLPHKDADFLVAESLSNHQHLSQFMNFINKGKELKLARESLVELVEKMTKEILFVIPSQATVDHLQETFDSFYQFDPEKEPEMTCLLTKVYNFFREKIDDLEQTIKSCITNSSPPAEDSDEETFHFQALELRTQKENVRALCKSSLKKYHALIKEPPFSTDEIQLHLWELLLNF